MALKKVGKQIIESYLKSQMDDFCAWIEYDIEANNIDITELTLDELTGIAVEALRNTLLHGSPPKE